MELFLQRHISQHLRQVPTARLCLRRDPAFRRTFALCSIWPAPRALTYRCCQAFWLATACRLTQQSTSLLPVRAIGLHCWGSDRKVQRRSPLEPSTSILPKTWPARATKSASTIPLWNPSSLCGSNRQYVESRLPHLRRILTGGPEDARAIADAESRIVSHSTDRIIEALLSCHRPRGFLTSMVVSGRSSRLWTAMRDSPGDPGSWEGRISGCSADV